LIELAETIERINKKRPIMNEKYIEIVHKEIDLIQNCINRMAQNSFLIKGWSLTVVAVVLALSEKLTDSIYLCMVILIPLVSFWYLDAFFLQTERMYRKMYEWVLNARQKEDYSCLYDLNPHRFENQVDSIRQIMWSLTLRVFYGIPFFIIVSIIIYKIFTKSTCK
jgi:hypothetical protein